MIDAKILLLIDELDMLRKSRDDHWQVPRAEGEMLHQIALSAGAMNIVEVGTSYGFSGLFWGAALKQAGGRLQTIDMNPKKFESSKATFERAGLGGVVTNHLGDAHQILQTISGPFDLAFIDADKVSTRAYFDILWPKIKVRGSILIDNATTHRSELADFVKYVRALPTATSTEVAVGNGVEWVIKTR